MRKIQYSFINEFGFATCNALQDSICFYGGVETVIFAEILFLSAGVLALTTPLFFFFFFHSQNKISNFVKSYRVGREVLPSHPLALKGYRFSFRTLNVTFIFQILKLMLNSIVKKFGRFFLLPFKRFRFLFCNSPFELHYKDTFYS